ncbi:leucine-rich repeat-containing protein 4B-like, partial [Tropilaelaps mercedesae]
LLHGVRVCVGFTGLQVLNMSLNTLKALQNNQVANAGLVNLQKLYLSQNQLRELQEHAFYKMNNLVELDLSHNKLGAVPTNAFKHLVNLRQLLLKGNPITVLEDSSFAHLRSLSVLELSSCKIETVARDAFAQLENLQVLKLDDNLISFISALTMAPLAKLHGISLDGNAWNCDCRLRPFRDWLSQHHPTSYSPTCHQPETIRGLSWEKIPDAVFSCPPNFTLNAQDYKVQTGSNLTLYCEAWGMPPPHIQWFIEDIAQDAKVVSISDSLAASQLHLSDVSTLNGGTYVCRASNSAGGSQLNFTVQVASAGDAHETHMAPTTTKGGVRILTDGHGYYSESQKELVRVRDLALYFCWTRNVTAQGANEGARFCVPVEQLRELLATLRDLCIPLDMWANGMESHQMKCGEIQAGNAGLIGLILGITTVSLVILSVVVLLLWSCRRGSSHHNSVLQDKRAKTPDTATALGKIGQIPTEPYGSVHFSVAVIASSSTRPSTPSVKTVFPTLFCCETPSERGHAASAMSSPWFVYRHFSLRTPAEVRPDVCRSPAPRRAFSEEPKKDEVNHDVDRRIEASATLNRTSH